MQLIVSKILNPKSEFPNPKSEFPNPKSRIPHPGSTKNLIFDFGGVICNIDQELTKKRFVELGFNGFDTEQSKKESMALFEDIETGMITPQQFRDGLKNFFPTPVTGEQLDEAWNAMLLDIPASRIRLLEKIR